MSGDAYDAILIVSFGGPEGPDDVMPFLENIVRGRDVPSERLEEVAQHYLHFGGISPHNQQIQDLMDALKPELASAGIDLPIYWGNRNWRPMLGDTVQQMMTDGVRRALAFVVSGYSSYSSCQQYRQNILGAIESVGEGAPQIDKIRVFYNHPDFIGAMQDRVRDAISELKSSQIPRLVFTAHSIPAAMASGCDYQTQLTDAARLVASEFKDHPWQLVYQSRSGPPHVPWLEPDVCDHIEQAAESGNLSPVVLIPIGFLSDHLEVLFDLDTEAADVCQRLDVPMARAATVGTHPSFVRMVRKLIQERLDTHAPRESLGQMGASHDQCSEGCCPSGQPGPS
jgi:ferrochelatase